MVRILSGGVYTLEVVVTESMSMRMPIAITLGVLLKSRLQTLLNTKISQYSHHPELECCQIVELSLNIQKTQLSQSLARLPLARPGLQASVTWIYRTVAIFSAF